MRFARPEKLHQLAINLGKATTCSVQQVIAAIGHSRLLQNPLHLLRHAMVGGHRHGAINGVSARLAEDQPRQGRTRANRQPPATSRHNPTS